MAGVYSTRSWPAFGPIWDVSIRVPNLLRTDSDQPNCFHRSCNFGGVIFHPCHGPSARPRKPCGDPTSGGSVLFDCRALNYYYPS